MDSTQKVVVAPAEELLRQIVERARMVPDSFREFTEPAERAVRLYRTPETVLTSLVDLGFPHVSSPGKQLFDRRDLRNVALRARLPSPQWDVMANAANALCEEQPQSSVTRVLEVVGRCPEPAHEGRCDLRLHPGLQACSQGCVQQVSAGHYRIAVTIPAGPPAYPPLPEAGRQLFASVRDLEFQHLPRALTTDLTFLRETRLADCRLAGFYLRQESESRGIKVRPAAGLFLARPFSMTHSWIEIWTEDRWQPVDPFFLTALARWGLLRSDQWPIDRSPVGVLWKIGTEDLPIMIDRGEPVDPLLATA
jgi:hypothetical protein